MFYSKLIVISDFRTKNNLLQICFVVFVLSLLKFQSCVECWHSGTKRNIRNDWKIHLLFQIQLKHTHTHFCSVACLLMRSHYGSHAEKGQPLWILVNSKNSFSYYHIKDKEGMVTHSEWDWNFGAATGLYWYVYVCICVWFCKIEYNTRKPKCYGFKFPINEKKSWDC